MTSSLIAFLEDNAFTEKEPSTWSAEDVKWIRDRTEDLAEAAFSGDLAAATELHHSAYRVFLKLYDKPWGEDAGDPGNPLLATFTWTFAREWDRHDLARYEGLVASIPEDPEAYAEWIKGVVQQDPSNVQHPLFDFLEKDANSDQLGEYVLQEAPFDLFFADILASLLPGVYGEPKMEIMENFWDEMGCGTSEKVHRNLRLDLMKELDLPLDAYRTEPERFLLEEIELANAYFLGAVDRGHAVHLIGMLLATESMVPGRLNKQIAGWRRVGLKDEQMTYLLEHTVADVEHAEDWMTHVVRPIIRDRPQTRVELTLGAARRLEIAGRICDSALARLQTTSFDAVAAA